VVLGREFSDYPGSDSALFSAVCHHLAEHSCSGVLEVSGGCEEHHTRLSSFLAQRYERVASWGSCKLVSVATTEFLEALRNMSIPLAKLRAGSDVLDPLVEGRLRFGHPPRPQPVDEDLVCRTFEVVIDPTDIYLDAIVASLVRR